MFRAISSARMSLTVAFGALVSTKFEQGLPPVTVLPNGLGSLEHGMMKRAIPIADRSRSVPLDRLGGSI